MKERVEELMRQYARTNEGGDYEQMARYFAPAFVAAGPAGAQVVKRDDFAAALPKRKQMFEAWGHRSSSLTRMEVTEIDPRRALVRTEWRMEFVLNDAKEEVLEVASIFLVEEREQRWEIVLYQACQDIAAMVKERGWIG